MKPIVLFMPFLLVACADFVPRDKTVTIDAQTGQAILPHPCPDWSQSSVINYDNSLHSNYGCAVNNNLAVQLENPGDLEHGYGSLKGDTDESVRTLQRYRAGEIPVTLNPLQPSGQQ
jgi:type IV pilus biogenesis protein CpaD/CtpE